MHMGLGFGLGIVGINRYMVGCMHCTAGCVHAMICIGNVNS